MSHSVPSPSYLDYVTDKKLHFPQAEQAVVFWSHKSTEAESKTFLCLILINLDSNTKLWNTVTSWRWEGNISLLWEFLACGTTCSMKDVPLLMCILSDVRKLAFFFKLLLRSSAWFEEKCLIKIWRALAYFYNQTFCGFWRKKKYQKLGCCG